MAINFSGLSNQSLLGRLTRLPLNLIPSSAVVPILQGALKGKKWIAGSSNHGCWLGSYELPKQRLLQRIIKPGMVCWDIGANVGFYSLLMAELTGPKGKVFAFEPIVRNIEIIRRHIALNRYSNITLLPFAICDRDATVRMDDSLPSSMCQIDANGSAEVPAFRIDTLLARGMVLRPDTIKIDIEGAELSALQGASHTLEASKPQIAIATHGHRQRTACLTLLTGCGYRVTQLENRGIAVADEFFATV